MKLLVAALAALAMIASAAARDNGQWAGHAARDAAARITPVIQMRRA
jgi:hypothetical protein